jgi:hypothetical protein
LSFSTPGLSNRANDAGPAKRARARLPRSPDETKHAPFQPPFAGGSGELIQCTVPPYCAAQALAR